MSAAIQTITDHLSAGAQVTDNTLVSVKQASRMLGLPVAHLTAAGVTLFIAYRDGVPFMPIVRVRTLRRAIAMGLPLTAPMDEVESVLDERLHWLLIRVGAMRRGDAQPPRDEMVECLSAAILMLADSSDLDLLGDCRRAVAAASDLEPRLMAATEGQDD